MTAALAESLEAIMITDSKPSTARAEASRANGRLSRGPTSAEGKERSRRNGCKDGLTGAGTVLPPDAAEEVERREAEFARDFRPATRLNASWSARWHWAPGRPPSEFRLDGKRRPHAPAPAFGVTLPIGCTH
jgi:hypothetical protein